MRLLLLASALLAAIGAVGRGVNLVLSTTQKHDTWVQVAAQDLAGGATLFFLTVFDAQQPPAAATALLVTSGIARPGAPLYGVLAGLATLSRVRVGWRGGGRG